MSSDRRIEELKQDLHDTLNFVEEELEDIESPIEKIFHLSLNAYYLEELIGDPMSNYKLFIDPQPELEFGVKKYRPDFEITMFQHLEIGGQQKMRDVTCYIECDGHDFHERTKEQAKKDRKKDRAFMTKGLHLIRFTGSEIYNSHTQCSKEVLDFMYDKLKTSSFKNI